AWSAALQVKETRYENHPIVSLINGGGIRDSIPEGIISRGQVISILPFGNILFLKEVSPAILYEVLENGVSKVESVNPKTGFITGVDGRYPQISGMRFEFDPSKTAANTTDTTKPFTKGERVTKIILLDAEGADGKALNRSDTTTKIVLASNNFETAGGDGYTMLKSLTNIGEGASLDIIFEEYITKLTKAGDGVFYYPGSKSRSKAITSHVYYPYTAAITVKKGREIFANSGVVYTIDKGKPFKGKTDEKGVLTIGHIESGPHSIALSSIGLSAYIYVNDLIDSTIITSSLGSEEHGNVSSYQFNQCTTRNNYDLQ
ncbi:5'-nucleotidase C-terminal domain-containing protein, partial [Peribacillus sp. NPDC060186]